MYAFVADARSPCAHPLAQMNILVTDDGRPVLADFGLVRLIECTIGGFSVTKNGFNARWTSPQRLEGAVRSTSDDVYSFACVCYYVSAHQLPALKLLMMHSCTLG
jgi:serine/threonine protein kinase